MTRTPRPPSPRRSAAAAAGRRLPAALAGRRARRGPRHRSCCRRSTGDQLATAVVVLALLDLLDLAPVSTPGVVADALDEVAVNCSPYRDIAVNPAKNLASAIADTQPMLWGGTVLAARAARRVAESIRRTTGRAALAADVDHLLPVIELAPAPDVFADPFADTDDAGDDASQPGDPRRRLGGADGRASHGPGCSPRPSAAASAPRPSPARPTATWPATRPCSPPASSRRPTWRSASADGCRRHGPIACATCLLRVGPGPSWPRCWPTSASQSRSSSRSCSPAPRRCWPRRSTRWPTPATRGCCCSAARQAKKDATPEHPFGYGRERYVYSFLVAIVLFSVGGLFALYEAYHKFHEVHAAHGHPEDSLLDSRWWWVPARGARGVDRDGGVLLPHRDHARPPRSRATRRSCSSSGAPSSPSCR